MPTIKKRVNLTIDDEVFETLTKLAKKEKTSIANVSNLLLERALELKEDLYFSRVGEDRIAKKNKRLSHDDIWEN